MLNATKAAAESLIIGTASAVNAVGKITQNASEGAASASKVIKSAGVVAESAGKVAESAGEASKNVASAGVHASSALSNVASLANKVTVLADKLGDSSVKAVDEYKKRSEERDKKKTELETIKLQEGFKTKDATYKQQTEAELLKIKDESEKAELEFKEKQNKNLLQAKKLEVLAEKLNVELEHAKQMENSKQDIELKNNYIGTKFGYKDANCLDKGWVKSGNIFKNNMFANYNTFYFYMITGLLSKAADYWQVEFNKEPDPKNQVKDGYYVYKDNVGIFKVRLENNVKMGSFYGSIEKKIVKLDCVTYVPECFKDRAVVPLDCSNQDSESYDVITKKEWFKTNKSVSIGGKTKRNGKKSNKKTKKTIKSNSKKQ